VETPTVLVVDYGAQYAQLIARRVREAQVFSEIVPAGTSTEEIVGRHPAAVILSGGPSSVYAEDAPAVDPALFEAGIPVFGMCYGFQAMAQALGGDVAHDGTREYGRTEVRVADDAGVLHDGLPAQHPVWMSHGDSVVRAPEGFTVTASTDRVQVAGFEDTERRLAGVQYHPEVGHSPHGQEVLRRFLHEIAGITPGWTTSSIIDETVAAVREQIGDGRAICGLSGGVDSAVAAAIVQRAIGDRLTCVFVDHGLLRAGEREQVERDFVAATGAKLHTVDAEERFLKALAGVTDPEEKRKIIGREFIRVFEAATAEVAAEEHVGFLVQGTLYPDVVESGGGAGTATIKSHHNVGGLPDDIEFALVEPLRALFKDEVRKVGAELGLPETIVQRQPFRGRRRAARDPARGGRHRPRGAHPRRPGQHHLAVPGRAARGRPQRGRAGRRPHLRPPGRPAARQLRGRDDGGLDPGALRGPGTDLDPDHERGGRGQPGRPGRHEQAAGHHRVGVAVPPA
jgi:GMP synthase (glutamine-hydrolysing)